MQVTESGIYHVADLSVDLGRRQVFRGGDPIALPALSFRTLEALMRAAPAPLSVEQLIEHAWAGAVVADETVTQRIRLLRQALGDDTRQPRYIETQRSTGYRLIPPLRTVTEPRVTRGPAIAATLLAIGLVAAAAFWWLSDDSASVTQSDAKKMLPDGPVTVDELLAKADALSTQRNPVSLANAVQLYEQALQLAPADARIQTSLAWALALSVAWYNKPQEWAQRAESLARQARASGVNFYTEHALAFSLDAQGKVTPAQQAYERAVALNPEHWGARASLAYLLQVQGRLVEALSHNVIAMRGATGNQLDVQVAGCLRLLGFSDEASAWLARAERLEPGSAHAAPMLARDHIGHGELVRAQAVIDQALLRGVEQSELYEFRVVLALRDGNLDKARAALSAAPAQITHRGEFAVWPLVIDATAGESVAPALAKAEAIRQAVAGGDSWPDNHLYVALLEAAAGRAESAVVALQRLFDAGYRDYQWLLSLPPLTALHGQPGFDRVVDAMRNDVELQRAQVLTADWLPDELRGAAVNREPPQE